ncbi:hypothetical protein WJX73_007891 [Symbiochloris irregularis]|uniref:Uncharacterized protein n=1 Tax=Symbiochloris irregularis TaxID=706552 RepID=A0AAW1P023_9CHLO
MCTISYLTAQQRLHTRQAPSCSLSTLHNTTPAQPCRATRLSLRRFEHVGEFRGVAKAGPDDKPSISRDTEPTDFWQANTEKKGVNPAKDPLAIMGVAGILLPFIIVLGLVFAGVIDPNPRGSPGI